VPCGAWHSVWQIASGSIVRKIIEIASRTQLFCKRAGCGIDYADELRITQIYIRKIFTFRLELVHHLERRNTCRFRFPPLSLNQHS